MNKRKLIIASLLIFSVFLSSFTFYIWQVIKTPNVLVGKSARILEIPEGISFPDLQALLLKQRIVEDGVSFGVLARFMDYDQQIKPGRYRVAADMTNLDFIRLLRSGNQIPVNITFNNVRLIKDLAPKITKNLSMSEEAFSIALIEFVAENPYGFNEQNIVGMFIPNTYEVYYTIKAEDLIEKMHGEYEKFWNDTRKQKAQLLKLTPMEVAALASIVQAESNVKKESPIIAGLYLNRLKQGMPLQADPTLVFAVGDFGLKRVLNVHKEIDSPYNTYKNTGLPPGPINMPEIKSLDAVLNYAQHDYLYMCAKEDFSGYHNFAASYSEHLKNARKYQRALSAEMRKSKQ